MMPMSATMRLLELKRGVQQNDGHLSASLSPTNDLHDLLKAARIPPTASSNIQKTSSEEMPVLLSSGIKLAMPVMSEDADMLAANDFNHSGEDSLRNRLSLAFIEACKKTINYRNRLRIEGTVGVVIDDDSVLLVHFNRMLYSKDEELHDRTRGGFLENDENYVREYDTTIHDSLTGYSEDKQMISEIKRQDDHSECALEHPKSFADMDYAASSALLAVKSEPWYEPGEFETAQWGEEALGRENRKERDSDYVPEDEDDNVPSPQPTVFRKRGGSRPRARFSEPTVFRKRGGSKYRGGRKRVGYGVAEYTNKKSREDAGGGGGGGGESRMTLLRELLLQPIQKTNERKTSCTDVSLSLLAGGECQIDSVALSVQNLHGISAFQSMTTGTLSVSPQATLQPASLSTLLANSFTVSAGSSAVPASSSTMSCGSSTVSTSSSTMSASSSTISVKQEHFTAADELASLNSLKDSSPVALRIELTAGARSDNDHSSPTLSELLSVARTPHKSNVKSSATLIDLLPDTYCNTSLYSSSGGRLTVSHPSRYDTGGQRSTSHSPRDMLRAAETMSQRVRDGGLANMLRSPSNTIGGREHESHRPRDGSSGCGNMVPRSPYDATQSEPRLRPGIGLKDSCDDIASRNIIQQVDRPAFNSLPHRESEAISPHASGARMLRGLLDPSPVSQSTGSDGGSFSYSRLLHRLVASRIAEEGRNDSRHTETRSHDSHQPYKTSPNISSAVYGSDKNASTPHLHSLLRSGANIGYGDTTGAGGINRDKFTCFDSDQFQPIGSVTLDEPGNYHLSGYGSSPSGNVGLSSAAALTIKTEPNDD